ncbi:MAG TPA: heme biosynthesis HemY N-terminal domain-containing protein [Stellaceae bacterium]|jgi:HemY protein|nr:heme biosynthesis HemY N-terminal domain-containing protein [Stellaceae bacterium]
MIRILVFIIALALLASGFAWIADRPGDIALTWMGYRVETSLMVALVALIVLVVAAILVWSILRGLWRAPEQVSLFFRHRRAMRGYLAITRGLVAVGSGDLRLARRSADDAGRLSPGDPLTLLLEAQAAQMAGDRTGAEQAFRAMTRRDETRLLGLRGLYIEAQRRNDHTAARRVAEEAAQAAPALSWAGQAVLDDRCAVADWSGALAALENMKSGLDKTDYRRKRAVLLTARALAVDETDRDASRSDVLEAVKLAPELVPAAALAGRRLAEADEQRKARRILERAWVANPHPDLADAYADVRLGDSARERLNRMQKLAGLAPGHIESALAVARVALDARDFTAAREALMPYVAAPTPRVAALMAGIEEAEHGDTGRVREWMARAVRASGDPAWTADGVVSEKWLPVSPAGRLDGFEWRVPLAEIGVSRPVIEVMAPSAANEPAPAAPTPQPNVNPEPAAAAAPAAEMRPAAASEAPPVKARPVEPVIPLVHAPDDPGPGSDLDVDAEPEAAVAPGGSRRTIKDLFK